MGEFFYHGIWRMDWGLGNPNKTAALITLLMVAVWGLGYVRKWGFWLALTLFTGLGVCLVHTFSRGGLIALGCGLLPLALTRPRPWNKIKLAALGVTAVVMVSVSVFLNAHQRYGQGFAQEDRSIANRIILWQAAPRMMVDAPSGWGLGNAGKAYTEWYQPLAQTETYRTLVNSHLTWLVEMGWAQRWLYVAAWSLALFLCWPSRSSRWRSIALGLWLAFAVAAFFSSVAESVWLWPLPLAALALTLGRRLWLKAWPAAGWWTLPLAATALTVGGLWWLGRGPSLIRGAADHVIIGRGEVTGWIVTDRQVLGAACGKTLRAYLAQHPDCDAIVMARPDAKISLEPLAKLILSGTARTGDSWRAAAQRAEEIILLNVSVTPGELGLSVSEMKKVRVLAGEFTHSAASGAWEGATLVQKIEGAGNYLPDWPRLVLEENP